MVSAKAGLIHFPCTTIDLGQCQKLFEEFSYEAIALYDEDLRCVEMNAAVTRLFQYSRDEYIGQHALLLVAPEDHEKIIASVKSGNVAPYEARLVRKDGSTFVGMLQGQTIHVDGKKMRVTTCRDITEMKALEEKARKKSDEFESIFHNSQVGIVLVDKDRNIVRANDTIAQIVGFDFANRDLYSQLSMAQFHSSPEASAEFAKLYTTELCQGKVSKREIQLRRLDGSLVWVSVTGRPISSASPPDLDDGVVWVIEDISDVKEAEAKMQAAFDELETIFNAALVGILVVNGDRQIYRVNQTFVDMIGYDTPQDWVGKSVREFHLNEESYQEFGSKFFNALIQNEIQEVDFQVKGKDGQPLWVSISGQAIDKNQPADLGKGVVWVARDISQRKEMEQQLLQLTRKDPLTNCCNRRFFVERCEHEIEVAKRSKQPISLLMMDLDRFKHINDQMGHAVGDLALCFFAELCAQEVRTIDVVGRIGGEEFAVLLPGSNLAAAQRIAGRICGELARQTETHDSLPLMTVSIGAVEILGTEPLETFLQRADRLLYKAKEQGRNRVEI